MLQSFKSFQLFQLFQTFLFFLILQYPFLSYNFFWYLINTLKIENDLWRNLVFSCIKKDNFYRSNALILKNWENGVKNYDLICKSLIDFNEAFILYNELQFFDWPSIVAHSPTGLMHIAYWSVILVHRNIQATTVTIGYIQLRQGLEC